MKTLVKLSSKERQWHYPVTRDTKPRDGKELDDLKKRRTAGKIVGGTLGALGGGALGALMGHGGEVASAPVKDGHVIAEISGSGFGALAGGALGAAGGGKAGKRIGDIIGNRKILKDREESGGPLFTEEEERQEIEKSYQPKSKRPINISPNPLP